MTFHMPDSWYIQPDEYECDIDGCDHDHCAEDAQQRWEDARDDALLERAEARDEERWFRE